jgi:hypothetical protein
VVLPGNSPTYSHSPIHGVHTPHISVPGATQVPTPHQIAQVEQPVRATMTSSPRSTVAAPNTTRELWEEEGPFQTYNLGERGGRTVPLKYTKAAVWSIVDRHEGYHARSLIEPEVERGRHYPVEFNSEQVCWVEVRHQEGENLETYWQAFRIAGTDLGLDITQREVEQYIACHQERSKAAEEESSPTRSATPSSLTSQPEEIIPIRESPERITTADREIIVLAESLHIDDHHQMSQTMPVQAQVGVIDPETGHMTTEDDVACYRANLPDQPDPPSGRYQVRRFLAGGDLHREPPNDMNSRGGFPGGFPGGNFPGWGPPWGRTARGRTARRRTTIATSTTSRTRN